MRSSSSRGRSRWVGTRASPQLPCTRRSCAARRAGADVVDIGMIGTEMLLRGRRARPRWRRHDHRVPQPEGVHGCEDRPARRTAGRRRFRSARHPRPRPVPSGRVPGSDPDSGGRGPRCLSGLRGQGHVVHRPVRSEPAPRRHRRRQRNGRGDAPSDPRPAAGGAVRCFFEADGSFPNHEPNPLLEENRRFIVAKVREERRSRHRLRRRRRPLLLRRRHRRVRARGLCYGAPRRVDAREAPLAPRSSTTSGPALGRPRHDRAASEGHR